MPTQIKIAFPRRWLLGGTESQQPAGLSTGLDNVLEVGLKKWHHAILQFFKFFQIVFAAKNFMADLCKTSGGGKTYIARAND